MSRRKRYPGLLIPALLLAAGVILRQIYLMGEEWMEEKQSWEVTAAADRSSGGFSDKTLEAMCTFPGLEGIWTVIGIQAKVRLDGYSAQTELRGVDLAEFPLEVVRSSGKRALGMSPLLAAGEEFFDGLQDKNGQKISSRQKKILMEHYGEMKAEILPGGEDGEDMIAPMEAGAEAGSGADTGEFLGIVKGNGLYMDQEQMKQWIGEKGIRPAVTEVWMRICGKKRAEQAQEALEKAGFVVEVRSAEDDVSRNIAG